MIARLSSGGIILPAVAVSGLFIFTLFTLRDMAQPNEPASVTIEITGHQWWWEARYPDYGFVTANEIHIPVDEPVLINVTTSAT